jgi:hypothetical protein
VAKVQQKIGIYKQKQRFFQKKYINPK